jgi:hypothetical protein
MAGHLSDNVPAFVLFSKCGNRDFSDSELAYPICLETFIHLRHV